MSTHLEINDEDGTIERCPHDKSHQFSIINNNLIRDPNLSPHVAWLIIYLLSNKDGWIIKVQQVVNFLEGKKGYGRDVVRQMFDKACEAGYMKRIDYLNNKNLKRVKYILSEEPKFKKSLQHAENKAPENQAHKNNQEKDVPSKEEKKKIYKKIINQEEASKIPYREHVFLTEDQYLKISLEFGDWAERGLDVLEAFKSSKGGTYKCDFSVFKKGGWLHDKYLSEKNKPNQSTMTEKNKELAKKIENKYPQFKAEKDHIDFGYPLPGLSYSENGFKDQVFSRLKKCGLDISNL